MKKRNILILFSVVLALLILTTACNEGNNESQEEVKDETKVTVEAKNEVDESIEGYIIQTSQPVVKIEGNEVIEDKINKLIQEQYTSIQNEFLEIENNTDMDYGLNISYIYEEPVNNILSIVVRSSSTTGTAYPFDTLYNLSFSLKDGEPLGLKDLFQQDYDYESILNSMIMEELSKSDIKDSVYENIQKPLSEEYGFYLTKDNLVILFVGGKLAPYAVGDQVFTIPLDSLKLNEM